MAAWFGSAFGLVPARALASQEPPRPSGPGSQLSLSSTTSLSPMVSLPSISLSTTGTQASRLSETLPAPRKLPTPHPQHVPTLEQLAECSLSGFVSSDPLSVSALNVSTIQDSKGPMDIAMDFHASVLIRQAFLHLQACHLWSQRIGREVYTVHTLNMKAFWFQQVKVATILLTQERACIELSETLLLRRVLTSLVQTYRTWSQHRHLAEENHVGLLCRRTWYSLKLRYQSLSMTEKTLLLHTRTRLLQTFFDILLWKVRRCQANYQDSELLHRRRLYAQAFHGLLRFYVQVSCLRSSVIRRLLSLSFSAWQYGFLLALRRNVLAVSYDQERPKRHLRKIFSSWHARMVLKRIFSRWRRVSRARHLLHKYVRLRRSLEMRHPKTQVLGTAFLEYLHMRIKINRTVRRLGRMRRLKRAMAGWRSRLSMTSKKLVSERITPVEVVDCSPLLSCLPADASDRSVRIPSPLRAISPIDLPLPAPPSPTPEPHLHGIEAGIQVGSKAALYVETKEYVHHVLEGKVSPRSRTIDQIVERYQHPPLSMLSAPNASVLPSSFGNISIPFQCPQAASGLTDPASPSAFGPSFGQIRDRFVASDPPKHFEGSGFLSMPDPEQYIVSSYKMLTARYDLVGSFDSALKKHYRAPSASKSSHTE